VLLYIEDSYVVAQSVKRVCFFSRVINKRTTISALAGLAMLSLSSVSIIGLGSPSSVQAQSPQSNQNSNRTVTIVNNNNNNITIIDVKQQLHAHLYGAILAAQNNDTFGVLMGLGKITEGLAAISTPSYFLFEDPLSSNGTTLADTSEISTTGSNPETTTSTSTSSTNNQSDRTGGEGAGSANTTPSAVRTDGLGSE
jgi:hypothetical protein